MESDRSMGSDSVFLHNDNEDDTDKDQNEDDLSSNTRSDHDDCTNKKYRLIANRFQTRGHRFSDPSITTAGQEKPSLFPIVTNLASHATSHITTQLYNPHSEMIFESGSSNSSSTNLPSDRSRTRSRSNSNSTSSEKPAARRLTGVPSTIAIINVNETPVESGKNEMMKKRLSLSKSEPKTMHETSKADAADELRTLSLRNLSSRIWNKETLF